MPSPQQGNTDLVGPQEVRRDRRVGVMGATLTMDGVSLGLPVAISSGNTSCLK